MTTIAYTAVIEAAAENTPITLADPETLAEREVVGYRNANWQKIAAAETVTGPAGAAAEIAADILVSQEVAELTGDSTIRVRVWEGADADLGTAPDAEVYSDES